MNTEKIQKTDIIIVGTGLAGISLAAMLKYSGLSCALIETQKKSANTNPRILALTPASRNILQSIDAWEAIDRPGCFEKIHVWDELDAGQICFDSADLGERHIGYTAEQQKMEDILTKLLKGSEHCQWHPPAAVELLDITRGRACISTDNGRQFAADLVVAADGAASNIRRIAGIGYKIHSYKQKALSCLIKTELPHRKIAGQRFLRHGPLAFLPMYEEYQRAVIWSTIPEHADELMSLNEQSFNQILAQTFSYRAGDITLAGRRAGFELTRAHADEYCRPRLALVGDAAHRLHPMAGQGANLSLLDAACLAEIILQAREQDKDIGAYPVLRKYARWRRSENSLMMAAIDGIKYLFDRQTTAFNQLRNNGMNIFDKLRPAKRMVMRHAMGLASDLPERARQQYH